MVPKISRAHSIRSVFLRIEPDPDHSISEPRLCSEADRQSYHRGPSVKHHHSVDGNRGAQARDNTQIIGHADMVGRDPLCFAVEKQSFAHHAARRPVVEATRCREQARIHPDPADAEREENPEPRSNPAP